jgi:hypothetical protein
MANPTTNYGFVLPTPTDLVTDLPADFDVALQGVDTRLKALQPGTTLGDIAYSSATANTNTRLAIGSTGNVLTVAGGVPSWATPATPASGMNLISRTVITSAATTTVDSLFSDTYENYVLVLNYGVSGSGNKCVIKFRYSTTTHSANYDYGSLSMTANTVVTGANFYGANVSAITLPQVAATQDFVYLANINRSSTASRPLFGQHFHNDWYYLNEFATGGFSVSSNQAWTGIELTTTAGNLSGVLSVYGMAKS